MNDDAKQTAAHMVAMYRDSGYSARERANDAAISYESNTPQFAFWCAVVDAIDEQRKEIR